MNDVIPISVAYGDGGGPEVMEAALRILRMAYANISVEIIEAGEHVYGRGVSKGMYDRDIESLRRTHILLLGPVVAPEGCVPVRDTLKARYGFERTVYAQPAFGQEIPAAAHYGTELALFEATHSPFPDLAGQDKADPSGMIHAALLLLLYIGDTYNARRIHNAWLCAMEEGIHPFSPHSEAGRPAVGTQAFADAVIERFGEEPRTVMPVEYTNT